MEINKISEGDIFQQAKLRSLQRAKAVATYLLLHELFLLRFDKKICPVLYPKIWLQNVHH